MIFGTIYDASTRALRALGENSRSYASFWVASVKNVGILHSLNLGMQGYRLISCSKIKRHKATNAKTKNA